MTDQILGGAGEVVAPVGEEEFIPARGPQEIVPGTSIETSSRAAPTVLRPPPTSHGVGLVVLLGRHLVAQMAASSPAWVSSRRSKVGHRDDGHPPRVTLEPWRPSGRVVAGLGDTSPPIDAVTGLARARADAPSMRETVA